jgi:hypothetical protein
VEDLKMWRKTLLPVAVITALALGVAANAQETPATLAPTAPAPAAPSYTDGQMQDFARATVELQALGSQDPAAMTRTIAAAGMSVEDYNRMGDAMRASPALAASLNPYLDNANIERTARMTRLATQGLDHRWSPPPRHAKASKSAVAHHGKARAHKGKAAKGRHQAAKRTGHATSSKHASHRRHRKG